MAGNVVIIKDGSIVEEYRFTFTTKAKKKSKRSGGYYSPGNGYYNPWNSNVWNYNPWNYNPWGGFNPAWNMGLINYQSFFNPPFGWWNSGFSFQMGYSNLWSNWWDGYSYNYPSWNLLNLNGLNYSPYSLSLYSYY